MWLLSNCVFFFFSSRRRHTRFDCDWSSDVCSSDLEARGEVRGGRFVGGFSGEQYALPEAVGLLRAVRRQETSGALVTVSGADPLNLVGIITPGDALPALATNRVLYRDGIPVAG